jgi:hypothetical protein
MATVTTRAGKGSPLTHAEVDANFTNLNTDKLETSAVSTFGGTLIDDADASAARSTLGLGTAATTASTDYAAASHTHTLSEITDAGTAAGNATSDFLQVSNNLSDLNDAATARTNLDVDQAGEALALAIALG